MARKDPISKNEYEVVIIGGLGHGLATAYYFAKERNVTNNTIVEKDHLKNENLEVLKKECPFN